MGNYATSGGGRFLHTVFPSASSFVTQVVQENCIVIFSTTTCPYCRLAKGVFDEMGVTYKTVELNQLQDGADIVKELRSITGFNTVPQVFVNGTCIGGGTETKQLYAEGKLADLVKQCAPCRKDDNHRGDNHHNGKL